MKCENDYCVYEENGECLFDEVELDTRGDCVECMYVKIPKNLLEELKMKHRKELEERYKEY